MQKKSQLSWDFLIIRDQIHIHTPIVEAGCLLSTDLAAVFDTVAVGVLESVRIDIRCLIRESTSRTR